MLNNWMTEEEAKGKCCQVKAISVATCFLAAATTNRGVEFEEDPSDKCTASRCMQWVWAPDKYNKHVEPYSSTLKVSMDDWEETEKNCVYSEFKRTVFHRSQLRITCRYGSFGKNSYADMIF